VVCLLQRGLRPSVAEYVPAPSSDSGTARPGYTLLKPRQVRHPYVYVPAAAVNTVAHKASFYKLTLQEATWPETDVWPTVAAAAVTLVDPTASTPVPARAPTARAGPVPVPVPVSAPVPVPVPVPAPAKDEKRPAAAAATTAAPNADPALKMAAAAPPAGPPSRDDRPRPHAQARAPPAGQGPMYQPHMDVAAALAAVEQGTLCRGQLRVNAKNPSQAFCTVPYRAD
jgi:hypothetical protein